MGVMDNSELMRRIATLNTAESSDGQDYIQAFDVLETVRRYEEDHIPVKQEDFGTLAVCAIRYCQGRMTYMPELVRRIIRPNLAKLSDKDLQVLINDANEQKRTENYGSVQDKYGWVKWRQELLDEQERRKS